MAQSTRALQQQYRDSSNFRKRSTLVGKFSTNRYSWYRWVFDQLSIGAGSAVLELGCGPGSLWKRNLDRIPDAARIILSDFSAGMLRDCMHYLGPSRARFGFCQLDASSLPFRSGVFDTIVANMMFYHVHDRPAALQDIRQALAPAGFFCATTTGRQYMRELNETAMQILQVPRRAPSAERFGLENGIVQLRSVFAQVEVRRFENTLRVTKVDPLTGYFRSMEPLISATEERWTALRTHFEQMLEKDGEIFIPIDVGILIAHN
jgi:ubiquinone/menaquinone biosynthesis C-methylase UbiE